MMLTLCDPVPTCLKDLWTQAAEVADLRVAQVPAVGDAARVRQALEQWAMAPSPPSQAPPPAVAGAPPGQAPRLTNAVAPPGQAPLPAVASAPPSQAPRLTNAVAPPSQAPLPVVASAPPATVGPHLLFVHARAVGGACSETEEWFMNLPGPDLAVLYSEAWEAEGEGVIRMRPHRWKAGTRLVRANLRAFLEHARSWRGEGPLDPRRLASGSWETVLREPVLELLGLLAPAAITADWRPAEDRAARWNSLVDHLVDLVRRAESSGGHEGWARATGVLGRLRGRASIRSQADAMAVEVEKCVDPFAPLAQRRSAYEALRVDLVRLLG